MLKCKKIPEEFSAWLMLMFSQITIKVVSMSVWADLHLTFKISWKSRCCNILYFLLSYCVLPTRSNSTKDRSDRLTLKELRTDINLFPVGVTPPSSKSHGKVGNLQKDQSRRLTGLPRLPASVEIKYAVSYLAAWIVCLFTKLCKKPLGIH